MTPVKSYRFGPASKIVVHSSRDQSIPETVRRNRKEKKESAFHAWNPYKKAGVSDGGIQVNPPPSSAGDWRAARQHFSGGGTDGSGNRAVILVGIFRG